jgi:hypothetical protein
MMSLGSYLFQMACWIAGFWLVYVVALRRETFFELTRWFLVVGLFASIVLPFFPVRYQVVQAAFDLSAYAIATSSTLPAENRLTLSDYLQVLYLLGILVFLVRFLWQIFSLYKCRKGNQIRFGNIKVFRLTKGTTPFSFFNTIYVSNTLRGETELQTVITHEKVHIDERHWADLLLLEIARALQWFNPLMLLYRKAMMQNHEFLADKGTLQQGVSARTYKAILANQMLGIQVLPVASGFSHYDSTKRIFMMNRDKTSPIKRLKLLWALPVIALLLTAFAKPKYVSGENPTIQIANEKTNTVKGQVTDEKGKALQGATIIVRNTTTGATTDKNGKFILDGVNPDGEIVISFVGYETVVRKIEKELNVSMKRATINIDLSEMPSPPPPPVIKAKVASEKGTSEDADQLLVVVDGKVSSSKIDEIDTKTIQSVNILKGDEAVQLYGEKGKNGVIEVKLKNEMASPPPPPATAIDVRSAEPGKSPLIIVDGKETNLKMQQIDSYSVESISVLKGESAIQKYGEKAKDGAVEITTKKDSPKKANSTTSEGDVSVTGYGNPNNDDVFVAVEEMPQFPGGHDALIEYLNNAKANVNQKGDVKVTFTVDSKGKITGININSCPTKYLGEKTSEILHAMPLWAPGKQRGKPVDVEMSMTISY